MIPQLHIRVFPTLTFTDPSSAVHFEGQPNGPVSEFKGYTIEKFTGWNDGLEPRRESVSYPGMLGTVPLPATLDARMVTVEGHAVAPTWEELEHLRRRLASLLSHGSRGRIQVDQGGREMYGYAALGGAPEFTDIKVNRWRASARFRLSFYMADGRKYGETRTYGPAVSVDVSHEGNYPSHPRVIVRCTTAMPEGYAVYIDGKRWRIITPMTPGQVHELDTRTGRVVRSGVVLHSATESGEPGTIPPFQQVTCYINASIGAGTIEVRVKDTDI